MSRHPNAPLMVHSNLLRANAFIERSSNRNQLLGNHRETLQRLTQPSNLWIPLFNYQFPKTKSFDLLNTKSELGPLTEFMRTEWAIERSFDPMFSFGSLNPIPIKEKIVKEITAFGAQTAFSTLVEERGGILFYGADISSITFIHHIESLSGTPLYRYDKIFKGVIIDKENREHEISYKYHVTPLNKHIDYDWIGIKQDLRDAGLLSTVSKGAIDIALYLPAYDLSLFWIEKLKTDPFYLLDRNSRSWVEPLIDKLGRQFDINDFEERDNG